MYDLIVIGAGPGGYESAAHAANLGGKVALIEKERLGGACLNVGCIPAKTFLRSSKLYHECTEAAAFGVRLGSVEFDMPAVVARKNRVVGALTKGVEGMLKRAGVEVIQGVARIAARGAVEVTSALPLADARGSVAYGAATVRERFYHGLLETRNILIATGSRPAVPPIPGIRSPRVFDSDSIFSVTDLPERIHIIGGGYIGLEFACFFNEVGAKVIVHEMLPNIAAGADQEIATRLQTLLTRRGVEFQLGSPISRIDPDEHYLNATGRSPNIQNLGLEALNIDVTPRGIRTSDQGKTNIPGIWACGDVTGRRMLAHAATREGIVAVNNMFGRKDRIRYRAIPSVIYTHPEVSAVGATEEELKSNGIAYKKSVVPMAIAGRFLIENENPSGVLKVLTGARYNEILGVHALGDASSEFIVAAAAIMERDLSASQAAQIVFPHPTVSEALSAAISAAGLAHA